MWQLFLYVQRAFSSSLSKNKRQPVVGKTCYNIMTSDRLLWHLRGGEPTAGIHRGTHNAISRVHTLTKRLENVKDYPCQLLVLLTSTFDNMQSHIVLNTLHQLNGCPSTLKETSTTFCPASHISWSLRLSNFTNMAFSKKNNPKKSDYLADSVILSLINIGKRLKILPHQRLSGPVWGALSVAGSRKKEESWFQHGGVEWNGPATPQIDDLATYDGTIVFCLWCYIQYKKAAGVCPSG